MSSSLDYLELCRLCLVKDRVSVPIFEDEGDVRQIFLKITACLPVKVSREDKLPKKLCDDCVYKVELFYQFWNTTANAEKQLLQWLGEVGGLEDKQGYVTEVLDTNVMKQERSSDSRLDGNVLQVGGHQNSIDMGMMDIITMPAGSEQQFTSVPMDTSGTVQTVQVVPGPSTQTTHDQMAQGQALVGAESEEDNSDDGCDNEEGLPVKEEHDDDQGDQPLEPTTFVALPCDEAGPSGLQQQKISDISEMSMQQTADNDPKTGCQEDPLLIMKSNEISDVIPQSSKATTERRSKSKQQRRFKCNFCSKFFFKKYALALHVRVHTKQSYFCNFCGQPELSAASLSAHLSKYHKKLSFNCLNCSKCFDTAVGLKTHARTHSRTEKKEKEEIKVKKKLSRDKNYACLLCEMSYKFEGYLKSHMAKKHADNPRAQSFRCEQCGFVTYDKYYIKKHVLIHTRDYKATCQVCGKKTIKSYMSEHMRIHTGEKPYVCCYCGMMFGGRKYLIVHERTHTGEKPYLCDLCDKAFTQESTLRAHIQCHMKEITQKAD